MALDRDPEISAEFRRNQMLDNQLQPDPELSEGPASGGRMALFAIAVIAILGVVFYGLNSTTPTNTATNTPSQTTATNSAPNTMAPSNPNANPGQTTGSAPASPQPTPPSSASDNSPGSTAGGSNAPAGSSSSQ
jgi:hypothetical protein